MNISVNLKVKDDQEILSCLTEQIGDNQNLSAINAVVKNQIASIKLLSVDESYLIEINSETIGDPAYKSHISISVSLSPDE